MFGFVPGSHVWRKYVRTSKTQMETQAQEICLTCELHEHKRKPSEHVVTTNHCRLFWNKSTQALHVLFSFLCFLLRFGLTCT